MILDVTGRPELGSLRAEYVVDSTWVELDRCPVCWSAEALRDILAVEADSLGPVTAECGACGYVFKRRRPHDDWLASYYASDWDVSGQRRPPKKRVTNRSQILDFCGQHLPAGARVLEVGAGWGSSAAAFRAAGHDVVAIEASAHRARFIAQELGIPCDATPLEKAGLSEEFDLVYSHNVLEHVTDPFDFVGAVARALRPLGLCYMTVPNAPRGEAPVQLAHYVPHQSGFTPRSLSHVLARHGLEPVKLVTEPELRLLAVKSGIHTDGPPKAESELRDWLAGALEARGRRRLLMWWRGGTSDSWYRSAALPGGRLAQVAVAGLRTRWISQPPARRRRLEPAVPEFLRGKHLRHLPVKVTGELDLPVRIRHPDAVPPIWIK